MLSQLEKNQDILPSTQDEALFCCVSSRKSLPSLLSLERVLDTIEANQGFPTDPSSLEKNTEGPATTQDPVFPPHPERRVRFPAYSRKESQHSHRTSRGGHLNLTLERNSRGRATILKHPDVPMPSSYTSLPCTALTVTPRIDSKHDGRCDSPVAPQKKAIDPYANLTGSLTLLSKLERRVDFHVSTRDEA